MSASGILWTASPIKHYGYGAGRAHPSVRYVACPVCEAPKGSLCVGADGTPHLDRHYKRCDAFRDLTREWRKKGWRPVREHNPLTAPRVRIVRGSSFSLACGFRGCTRKALRVLKVGTRPQLRCCFSCGIEFARDHHSRAYLDAVRRDNSDLLSPPVARR